jgi:hypothetical protein
VVAQFRRARKGGFSVTFGQSEARVLRHVLGEMLELLGPEAEPADDPLAAALGIGTATTAPSDPALAATPSRDCATRSGPRCALP